MVVPAGPRYAPTSRSSSSFSRTRRPSMQSPQLISPCLWFDTQAEEAANFYVSIFKNSKITKTARYTEAGREHHHKAPGTVMTVAFELNGQPFTALNGGPIFQFTPAISFVIYCETQAEVDH